MFADLLLQEVILSTLVPDLTYKLRTDNLPERHVTVDTLYNSLGALHEVAQSIHALVGNQKLLEVLMFNF